MNRMMNMVLGVMLLAGLAITAKAQEPEAALDRAYKKLEAATDGAGRMSAANDFRLIATTHNKSRAASYYMAYADAWISLKESDSKRRDQLLDDADQYLSRMNALGDGKDEAEVLAGYIAFARFSVDPANRWKKYLSLMSEHLEKAKKVNPDNPRIYYLEGIPVFNKPKLYGGGKNKAKPYFEKAKALFALQKASSISAPSWGEAENAAYLAQCE